ncbi:sigma factor, partial [Lysobacter sp. D1-1-M9]|uniref:sigma factor n=1 Tax=Novilysobacter longmucuonensis TaxID=3098603 RepID=UPI002FCA8D1C
MDQAPPATDAAALAREHGRSVFLAAYRVLGNAAQAEDIQQEVFLRVLESRCEGVESWAAYLG